jgi:flavin reductase
VFCVNILPEGASALAGRFAGRFDAEEPDRFGAIDCRDTASGPVISGATTFECTVDQNVTHGSHDIYIGNVTAITNAATPPLAYMNGIFQVVRPEGAS